MLRLTRSLSPDAAPTARPKGAVAVIHTRPPLPVRGVERERALRLHRLCKGIEARRQKGVAVLKSARRASRRWHGKAFRCDPSRHWSLTASRLNQLFYDWQRDPRPEVFVRKWCAGPGQKLPRAVQTLFHHELLAPNCASIAHAVRMLGRRFRHSAPPRTYSALHRSLSKEALAALRKLFQARRAAARAEQNVRSLLKP